MIIDRYHQKAIRKTCVSLREGFDKDIFPLSRVSTADLGDDLASAHLRWGQLGVLAEKFPDGIPFRDLARAKAFWVYTWG